MNVREEAVTLEGLLPQAMTILFRTSGDDPLRHHTVGQVRLMRSLLGGPRAATELSHVLNLSPSSLTQMASRMIAAGLVVKELDPHDRRVRMLSLTHEGRKMMEKRRETRALAAAEALARLSPDRIQDLMNILREICDLDGKDEHPLLEAAV